MTAQNLAELYILSRSLWWRHDLEQLDAEAVAAVIAALETAQKDIAARLSAEAAGLVNLSDWRREQDEALNAWADEVLAGARATITGTVSEASIAAAVASLAAVGLPGFLPVSPISHPGSLRSWRFLLPLRSYSRL